MSVIYHHRLLDFHTGPVCASSFDMLLREIDNGLDILFPASDGGILRTGKSELADCGVLTRFERCARLCAKHAGCNGNQIGRRTLYT